MLGGLFGLLSVFLVGAFFVAGYMVRVVRRSAKGEPFPLPDWDELGGMFSDGLRAFGVYITHFLGLLVVLGTPCGVFFGAVALMSRDSRELPEPVAALAGLALVAAYGLFLLLSLALAVYLPAALARFVMQDRFAAAFDFRENLAFIRRNPANYFLALLTYLLASFLSQFGLILCCVGIFPAGFWASCVLAYSMGEVVFRDAAGLPVGTPASRS